MKKKKRVTSWLSKVAIRLPFGDMARASDRIGKSWRVSWTIKLSFSSKSLSYTFPIHELLLLQQDRAIAILFTSDLISTDLVLTTAAFALIDTWSAFSKCLKETISVVITYTSTRGSKYLCSYIIFCAKQNIFFPNIFSRLMADNQWIVDLHVLTNMFQKF